MSGAARGAVATDAGWWPGLLLLAAIAFNPLLAIVNGNVTPLTSAPVVLAEIALVGAAHLVILRHWRMEMSPWYVLLGLFVAIAALRSAAMGQVEVKALRDVLLLPTFALLGMVAGERRLVRVVIAIQLLVLVVMALEWLNVDAYAALFRIKDYYINTRGYAAEEFTNAESQLYISADRPEERVFSFVQIHRLSSVFLEPVSLGNHCIIVTAFIAAYRHRMGMAAFLFLAVSNLVVLVGCDGRLAVLCVLLIVGVSLVARWLPQRSNLLYLPGAVALAAILVELFALRSGADTFAGRIAYTVDLLARLRVDDLLGVSAELLPLTVDSGVAYIIVTQSIFGLALIWCVIVALGENRSRAGVIYGHALCLYLALSMLVSYAFLSIKTASLLWFLLGAFQWRGTVAGTTSPARPTRQMSSSVTA